MRIGARCRSDAPRTIPRGYRIDGVDPRYGTLIVSKPARDGDLLRAGSILVAAIAATLLLAGLLGLSGIGSSADAPANDLFIEELR